MQAELDKIDNRLQRIEDKLDNHLERVSRLEESRDGLNGHIKLIYSIVLAAVAALVSQFIGGFHK